MKRLFLLLGMLLGFSLSSFTEAKTDTLYFKVAYSPGSLVTTTTIDYRFSEAVLNGGISIDIEDYYNGDDRIYPDSETGSITINRAGYFYGRIYYTNTSQTKYTARFDFRDGSSGDMVFVISGGGTIASLDVHNCSLLDSLFCSCYYLNSLDVSGCSSLSTLSCYNTHLDTLDVSGCSALTDLDCRGSNGQLRSLDVSGCSALERLYCSGNYLRSLDVSGCSALTDLDCHYNKLTSLDMSGHTALTSLNCSDNQLTSLDVSGCSALTDLDCRYNQLTSLDVSSCSALESLYCSSNKLTSLDVSSCSALESLYCSSNKLTALDVSGCSALTELNCEYNKLITLNASGCSALTTFDFRENSSLTSLEVSGCSALASLSWSNGHLTSLDVSSCTALTTLNCPNNQLTSLNAKGCSALKTFNLSGNDSLSSLNVSGCSALVSLNCSNRQLTDLDVSGCSALERLDCYENQLTSLDVSGCSALTLLYCHNNKLTSLNASGCSVLTTIYFIGNNSLTSLNVSGCSSLTKLSCYNNQLTSLDVNGCTALTELNCENNQLTTLDVSSCTALTELNCENNQLTSFDVSNNSALTGLNCNNNQLTSLDVSGFSALTLLYCHNNKLTSLDVSGCSALTELSCYDNQLTALDVSGCSALTELSCYGNQLTALDVSGCSALTELSCYGNQLTDLDVSGCSALTELYCRNNKLTTLDVSGFSALERLDCYDNQLTSLDVSGCSALTRLYCHNNKLTTLDVSGCSALTDLSCYDNKLTSLDVSGCSALTDLSCYDNHIPLSTLYNIYIQSSDWTGFWANPQSDSITLLVGEALDLSSEGNLGGNTTDVSLYLDDQDCPDDYYTENNFTFLFCRPNEYRLELGNYLATSLQFSYYLSVKLPDGYFGIYVNANSKNMGTASISGNGSYQEGTEVTITATPVSGYRFVNWTRENGEVFSTEAEYTFMATENLELTANFEENTFTLNCYTNNSEWGYTSGAEGTYFEGEEVTIYASPYYHYHFVNWTKADGSVYSTEAEHTFIITEDLELTANFEQDPTFTLALHVNNSEWGYTSGYNDTYYEGDEVWIGAYPCHGYHFVNWTKADGSVFSTEAEHTFIITEDLELTANFEQDPTFTLALHVNNSEWGSTSGADGTYFEGEEVTIYASPNYGYHFVNWTKADGSVFSTEAEYTFIIKEDLELTANFEQDPTFTVVLHVNNPEWGYTEIVHYGYDDTYREGDEVRIYAYSHYGYHFVNWTKADGSVFSSQSEYTFMIEENLELTANFAPDGGVDNENHENDNFVIYVQDRTICLSENRGAVQVFNTTGQCIYNGFSTRIPAPHSGVYIVKVGTRSYKVMIR